MSWGYPYWLVVWNMNGFFSPIVGIMIQSDCPIFQGGRSTTNQPSYQPFSIGIFHEIRVPPFMETPILIPLINPLVGNYITIIGWMTIHWVSVWVRKAEPRNYLPCFWRVLIFCPISKGAYPQCPFQWGKCSQTIIRIWGAPFLTCPDTKIQNAFIFWTSASWACSGRKIEDSGNQILQFVLHVFTKPSSFFGFVQWWLLRRIMKSAVQLVLWTSLNKG